MHLSTNLQTGKSKSSPEDFENGFAVGSHFLNVQPCVPINGGCVPLDAKVTAQLEVEPNLHHHECVVSQQTRS